jgi:hypothetical protein
MAVSTAVGDTPGNSQNAKMFQKNGWMGLYTDAVVFASRSPQVCNIDN